MLTDENLKELLRSTFTAESAHLTSPPGLKVSIRRRDARRRLGLTVAAPAALIAVAAIAAAIAARPSVQPTHDVTAEAEAGSNPSRIQLAGYTFTLPENFGARDGSCELTLPDGTIRTGIPGADGACAVLMDADVTPSWLSGDWPDGAWVVGVSDDGSEFITITVTGRDPATKRYLFLAVKMSHTAQEDLPFVDLQRVLDDGLGAARSASN